MISQFCFCIAACNTFTQNMNCERFFIISTFSKAIENLSLYFLKNFLQTKFFFLFISCTRNRHSRVIESYIERDNVIKCEFNTVFIEKSIHYLIFTDHCRESIDKFSQIVIARHVAERIIIQFLKRREIE